MEGFEPEFFSRKTGFMKYTLYEIHWLRLGFGINSNPSESRSEFYRESLYPPLLAIYIFLYSE